MRTLLLAAAAFGLLTSTAQAQVICQRVGGNMMCSDGTIIYGLRSYSPEQAGEFAFGQGLAAGRGALESQSRQQLLNQQTEQLKLQNELLGRQSRSSYSPPANQVCGKGPDGYPVCGPGAGYLPPKCRPSGANTFSCD